MSWATLAKDNVNSCKALIWCLHFAPELAGSDFPSTSLLQFDLLRYIARFQSKQRRLCDGSKKRQVQDLRPAGEERSNETMRPQHH